MRREVILSIRFKAEDEDPITGQVAEFFNSVIMDTIEISEDRANMKWNVRLEGRFDHDQR